MWSGCRVGCVDGKNCEDPAGEIRSRKGVDFRPPRHVASHESGGFDSKEDANYTTAPLGSRRSRFLRQLLNKLELVL